ncbi:MAG: hypothetical protein ACK5MH_05410 [Bacteroidales bacterium]
MRVENSKINQKYLLLKKLEAALKHYIQDSLLRGIIQWFKTMTTNEYIRGVKQLGWDAFDGKLWQRNYYEHIIRNETSYLRIVEYINNNPANWKEDKMFE